MRLTPIALSLSAGTLLVPSLSASASPRPVALAGVTTIVATQSGSADFDLFQDAVIQLRKDGSTNDVVVRGGGPIAWAELKYAGTASSDGIGFERSVYRGKTEQGSYVNGTTYPQGSTCPDSSVPATVYGVYQPCQPTYPTPTYVVLHQGHYHLRVFTGGKPLTMTVHLHGLAGSRTAGITKRLAASLTSLSVIDTVAQRNVRAEAALNVGKTAEARINIDADLAPGPTYVDAHSCRYAPGAVRPTDYAPECPQGSTFAGYGPFIDEAHYDPVVFGQTGTLPPGPQRLGINLADDQGVTFRSAQVALLQNEG